MKTRLFFGILLLICSCSSAKKMEKNRHLLPIVDTYWLLHAIKQDTVNCLSDPPPYIIFEPSGQYSGYSGCNRIFGHYYLTSKKIELDYSGSTKRICYDHPDTETAFLKMLKMEICCFKQEKDTLWLSDKNDVLLQFVATDSIPGVMRRVVQPETEEEVEELE